MLQKIKQAQLNHEEGFTLTELIVVIVIIGILAAIAVPMYLNNRKQAIDAQTESNVKSIASTADRFFYENPKSETLQANIEDEMRINGEEGTRPLIFANADAKGYCVMAWNESGGKYKDFKTALTFDSSAGGLNQWSEGCNKAVPLLPPTGTHACQIEFNTNDLAAYYYRYNHNDISIYSIASSDGENETGFNYQSQSSVGVDIKIEILKDGTQLYSKEEINTYDFYDHIDDLNMMNDSSTNNGLEINVYENGSLVLNTNYKTPSDFLTNIAYCKNYPNR